MQPNNKVGLKVINGQQWKEGDCQGYPHAETKILGELKLTQGMMAVTGERRLWRQTSAGDGGMSWSMSEGKGLNPLN